LATTASIRSPAKRDEGGCDASN